MPEIAAGKFIRFTELNRRGKQKMVAGGVKGNWPEYRVPPDYWVRLRWSLQQMIRTCDYSAKNTSALLAKVPADRIREVADLLQGFIANWPRLRAKAWRHRRLKCEFGPLVVRCQPHAAVTIDEAHVVLRFAYRKSGLLTPTERAHAELLRLAAGSVSARAGVLNVALGAVGYLRQSPSASGFLDAEADEFMRLWRLNGGK